jgi:large subunit ribosomal protein L6
MSRIGKKEITIPTNVCVTLESNKLTTKSIFGSLEIIILDSIEITLSENKIEIRRKDDSKKVRALHGLIRANIQNMIVGVSEKFSKVLIVEGVGYKFQQDKDKLILNMGYSHTVELIIPKDLSVKAETLTKLTISGIDKQKVGLFASEIRKIRPPEPYKGKGIRYDNEIISRKVGKTGKK